MKNTRKTNWLSVRLAVVMTIAAAILILGSVAITSASSAVAPAAPKFTATLSVSPNTINYNGSTTVTIKWANGTGPYNVTVYVVNTNAKNTSCEDSAVISPTTTVNGIQSTSLSVRKAPAPPGAWLCAIVTGANSIKAYSNSTFVTVIPPPPPKCIFPTSTSTTTVTSSTTMSTTSTTTIAPFPVVISASPTTVNTTTPIMFTVTWIGGKAPYTVTLFASHTASCNAQSTQILSQSDITSTQVQVRREYYLPGAYFCAAVTSSTGNTALSNTVYVTIN